VAGNPTDRSLSIRINLEFEVKKARAKSAEATIVAHHAMKNLSCRLFIPLVCIFTTVQSLNAQESTAAKPKQFIYVLRLVPRLHADSAWTKEDKAVLERHFARFQEAAKSRQLILTGRMSEPGDKTFGTAALRRPMKTQRESSCKKIQP
jgi:hypothetical protein